MHPSSTTWNWTYTWNQPLDMYMPWIACQTLFSKPVLLSNAMWNSWQHPDLRVANSTRQPKATTRASTPHPDTTSQKKGKPQTNSTDRLYKHCRILVSDGQSPALQVRGDLDTLIVRIPMIQNQRLRNIRHLTTMMQNHHLLVPTSCPDGIPPQAVVFVILSLFFSAKATNRYEANPRDSMEKECPCQYCYQQVLTVSHVKTRKSCCHWSLAIIQRKWDTAWDLTTHRNIKKVGSRAWPTHLSGTVPTPSCKFQHRQQSIATALNNTTHLVTPRGRALTHYSSKCVRS